MKGLDLIAALERHGFSVVRRSKPYVWIGRGKDVLLVDEDAELAQDVAEQLLDRAKQPPGSAG